ncbi:periostin isoform X2 [Hyperolius riggenbachi]|uniref:periostin isoform X2 n=1 Tax=Hyperolius riggenbachi TaxID=752182 RepID=UPI0035A30EE1
MKRLFLCIFATFLLSAFDHAEANGYYDKILTHSRIRAKNQGPNVCALQQVQGTKKKYFSTCKNWHQKAICGKQATVLYECCPGYMAMNGQKGCPAVAPIDHVYGTLKIVGATSTQDYSDRSELRPEIEGVGSFTFFAPSNDAWDLLDPEIRSSLLSNVNIELLNALHYHMLDRRMLTKDLKNGMTVTSMFNDQPLLIHHYTNGIVTVNCARVIHGNQIATNGVVHVIDRVVTAVGNTIGDFVDSEDELSSLRAAAIASKVLEKLEKPGHYTLFAPTDDAFSKLPPSVLERILGDEKAAEALVKYHILDFVQCSEAILAGGVYDTLEGSPLQIGCDGDSLTVNGKKLVSRKDIVTTNGVIHLIDDVLIPDSAKQVLELVGSQQTTFTDYMAQMGLAASLRPEAQYTLLAPLNDAFTEEVKRMDQRTLKLILQNHIIKDKFLLNGLYNGQTLETVGGKLLRVFVYRTAVCIENSCMLRGSKEGRNGAIHTFRELVKPAEKSFYDILSTDKRFSIFLDLIQHAELKELLSGPGAWSLIIPTNDAFKDLSREDIEILKRNKLALQNILLYHLAPGVFVGGGFESGVTNIVKSLQGGNIWFKFINGSLTINGVKVLEKDMMGTNGVIHVVDKFMFPADGSIGDEQLLGVLNKIVKYITIKLVRGSKFQEIPFTKYITTVTKKVITEPVKTITRVIGGETIRRVIPESTITKVTKIVEGPEVKVIPGGETRITRVIQGDPSITKITKVIEGDPEFSLIKEGETRVTKVIQGPEIKYTRVSTGLGSDLDDAELTRRLEEEVTRVSKFIEGDSQILDDDELKRLLQGETQGRRVQTGTRRIQGPTVRRKLRRSHQS